MRNRVSAFRSRTFCQAAAVAILAGLTGACSSGAARFQEPFFTGSTENQREIIDGAQPMPAPIVTGNAVTRGDLAPPPGAVASIEPPPLASPGPTPVARMGGPTSWSAVGGSVVTVAPGESLDSLAIRYGVPATEIARANQISNPSDLKPGRTIVIPVRVASAAPAPVATSPAFERPSAPAKPLIASVKAGSGVHVVQPGQTLYGIAREHNVRVEDIAALNGLSPNQPVKIGQQLKLPAGATASTPVAAAAPVAGPGAPPKPLGTLSGTKVVASLNPTDALPTAKPLTPRPTLPPDASASLPRAPAAPTVSVDKPDASPGPVAAANAIDDAANAASSNGTSFRWPVRGRIIASFGTKPNGERNDGINLAVPEGTSVKAAEAGTVIYAGNELEGYGNLVLIRHADGWVSAYAHNASITVKRGDQVRRGQNIALAGMTGSVKTPQVHFELRRGAKPVNPLDYLAGA
jgi:murein DD-endopeptidase MepM/ murein hydrolase activator NlpD